MVSRISNWRVDEISVSRVSVTRNPRSYLERPKPGVYPDNVRFPLVSRASGSSQPGRASLKISISSISSLRVKPLMKRTVLAMPDA